MAPAAFPTRRAKERVATPGQLHSQNSFPFSRAIQVMNPSHFKARWELRSMTFLREQSALRACNYPTGRNDLAESIAHWLGQAGF